MLTQPGGSAPVIRERSGVLVSRLFRFGSIRLILLVVFGVPMMLCLAVGSFFVWLVGDGSIDVLAPPDGGVDVWVDGAQVASLKPGEHRRVDIPQGDHRVRFVYGGEERSEQPLDVNSGFDRWFLVGDANRCFAVLDVTEVVYGDAKRPVLEDRFRGDAPHEVPAGVKYDVDDLPERIKKRDKQRLLQEIPCELLDAPADALLGLFTLE